MGPPLRLGRPWPKKLGPAWPKSLDQFNPKNDNNVTLETSDCGALYSQTPPRVNACKPAGEWQTYDILFRAPRLDADGKVVEYARATVFQNGVVVQNNTEFQGPTGIQGPDFPGMPATGPILLQGDHDPVQYRNIWVLPL